MEKNIKDVKKQRGFSLVEVVAAIAVLSFGIVGVYMAFSTMIVSTYNISARFTAAYLAQEGLEIVKNLRDNNFIDSVYTPAITWSTGINIGTCLPTGPGCMLDYKTSKSGTWITAYNGSVLFLDNDGFYSSSGGTPTIFKRKVTITPVPGLTNDALNVDVLVMWTYNGKSFSFDANEYIYNWY